MLQRLPDALRVHALVAEPGHRTPLQVAVYSLENSLNILIHPLERLVNPNITVYGLGVIDFVDGRRAEVLRVADILALLQFWEGVLNLFNVSVERVRQHRIVHTLL